MANFDEIAIPEMDDPVPGTSRKETRDRLVTSESVRQIRRVRRSCKMCNQRKRACNLVERQPCENCSEDQVDCIVVETIYRGTGKRRPSEAEIHEHDAKEAARMGLLRSLARLDIRAPNYHNFKRMLESSLAYYTGPHSSYKILCEYLREPGFPSEPIGPDPCILHLDEIQNLVTGKMMLIPPLDVSRWLVYCFFVNIYPHMPFLDKIGFVDDYNSKFQQPSALLLLSILCAGSRTVDSSFVLEKDVKNEDFTKRLYHRANVLFHADHELDVLSKIMSALCLSFVYDAPWDLRHGAYYWTRVAINLAMGIGLNGPILSGLTGSLRKRGMLKRLWCCLVVRDQMVSAAYDRPPMINADDDAFPKLSLTDFDIIYEEKDACENDIDQADYFIHQYDLALRMRRILKYKECKPVGDGISETDATLVKWLATFPNRWVFTDLVLYEYDYLRSVLELQYAYYVCLGNAQKIIEELSGPRIVELPVYSTVFQAAHIIAAILDEIHQHGDTHRMQTWVCHAGCAAMALLYVLANSEIQELRDQAFTGIGNILITANALADKYDVARMLLELHEKAVGDPSKVMCTLSQRSLKRAASASPPDKAAPKRIEVREEEDTSIAGVETQRLGSAQPPVGVEVATVAHYSGPIVAESSTLLETGGLLPAAPLRAGELATADSGAVAVHGDSSSLLLGGPDAHSTLHDLGSVSPPETTGGPTTEHQSIFRDVGVGAGAGGPDSNDALTEEEIDLFVSQLFDSCELIDFEGLGEHAGGMPAQTYAEMVEELAKLSMETQSQQMGGLHIHCILKNSYGEFKEEKMPSLYEMQRIRRKMGPAKPSTVNIKLESSRWWARMAELGEYLDVPSPKKDEIVAEITSVL